eukprot:7656356-Ditylum_brightwellii.AAC.1
MLYWQYVLARELAKSFHVSVFLGQFIKQLWVSTCVRHMGHKLEEAFLKDAPFNGTYFCWRQWNEGSYPASEVAKLDNSDQQEFDEAFVQIFG